MKEKSQTPQSTAAETNPRRIAAALEEAVAEARKSMDGGPASYCRELAEVPLNNTSAAIMLGDGSMVQAGDAAHHRFALQSVAKMIPLIGMLEEMDEDKLFSLVDKEPTGGHYWSVARLETHGPLPSNPLINAGAITLCAQITGDREQRMAWLQHWAERLFGEPLPVDPVVVQAERRTGDHNRSMGYMLRQMGLIAGSVDETLETYFALCSMETDVATLVRLPALLARGGVGLDGRRVLSQRTVECTLALMATCGMYDESGGHLVATGMPAKSGVSGAIIAVALGQAGVAVCSPRIDRKGSSVRGQLILKHLAPALGWHFARLGTGTS